MDGFFVGRADDVTSDGSKHQDSLAKASDAGTVFTLYSIYFQYKHHYHVRHRMQVEVVIGDITRQADMEAVVNSANPNLKHGRCHP